MVYAAVGYHPHDARLADDRGCGDRRAQHASQGGGDRRDGAGLPLRLFPAMPRNVSSRPSWGSHSAATFR
jgi:hypothetical protein